jgi:hypothetical protein
MLKLNALSWKLCNQEYGITVCDEKFDNRKTRKFISRDPEKLFDYKNVLTAIIRFLMFYYKQKERYERTLEGRRQVPIMVDKNQDSVESRVSSLDKELNKGPSKLTIVKVRIWNIYDSKKGNCHAKRTNGFSIQELPHLMKEGSGMSWTAN